MSDLTDTVSDLPLRLTALEGALTTTPHRCPSSPRMRCRFPNRHAPHRDGDRPKPWEINRSSAR
jgi:hypothetical protein